MRIEQACGIRHPDEYEHNPTFVNLPNPHNSLVLAVRPPCVIVGQSRGMKVAACCLKLLNTGLIGSIDMLLDDERTRVLSSREREVAQLVARGLSNKEVARELGLSDGTVKIHIHSIFQKLGAKSRYRLIAGEPAK